MEPSVTPWRVLDAETDPGRAAAGPDDRAVAAPSPTWQTWPVVGGIAVAVLLAVLAVVVVASGPTPVAIVQADAAPVAAGAIASDGDQSRGSAVEPEIVVHVAGAVRRPGLVRLPAGARVADAIEAAGGLGPRVDVAGLGSLVNLAAVVADGDRVVVPSRDDPGGPITSSGEGAAPGSVGGSIDAGGPVDLNHASADALEALPGIGEVTAARIIEARTERPFGSVDELLERKVVGPATLAKIRDLVVVH